MTKLEIQGIFENQSPDDIARSYSKRELEEMLAIVYGVNIRVPGNKKIDIAYSIKRFFDDMKRTKDLCKNLR